MRVLVCFNIQAVINFVQRSIDVLINWIMNYYSSNSRPKDVNQALYRASAVTVTDRIPFILQHDGHSRTIVGYETMQSSTDLLMFDPGL